MKCYCNFHQSANAMQNSIDASFSDCCLPYMSSRTEELRCSIQCYSFCQQAPYSSLPRTNSFRCKHSSYFPSWDNVLPTAYGNQEKLCVDLLGKLRQITNYCGVWLNRLHATIFSFWCSALCFVLIYERWEKDEQSNGVVWLLVRRAGNLAGPFIHPTNNFLCVAVQLY